MQIRVSDTGSLISFLSEPYVSFGTRGYTPVVDVQNVHTREKGFLVITAISLGEALHSHALRNGGRLLGLTLLVRKSSRDRMAPYVVVDPESMELDD